MSQEDKIIDELTSEPEQVVRKIRFLIDAHHETVPGLAKGVGVLPDTIQDVLDGQSLPSSALVRRIAERFSLPLDFFSSEACRAPKPKRAVRKKGSAASQAQPSTQAPRENKSAVNGTQDESLLQQALIELLIQKGVISADEWNARVRLVARRNSSSSS